MKYISLTNDLKNQVIQKFTESLDARHYNESKVTFTFDLSVKEPDKKANVIFSKIAWIKMWALVDSESGEIGWHGTVERIDDTTFYIKDIYMYPQFVTNTTVDTDDVEYGMWLHKDLDEDVFNHLRFHGHSHVNMSTNPSGVDTTWYNQILQGLTSEDFYIFMIVNKRREHFIEIYDLKTNTLYEKQDINWEAELTEDSYLTTWLDKTKEANIKAKKDLRLPETNIKTMSHNDFVDVLLDLTEQDLQDPQILKVTLDELSKEAMWNGYYGVGYTNWVKLKDIGKVRTAQAYYDVPIKVKQQRYNKNKMKTKRYNSAWEDYYDKYN